MIEYPEKHAPTFRQVTWAEIEQEVQQVNPEFHSIVCELDPGPEYRLYLGEYPYGCQILERGKFRVPVGGVMKFLDDASIPETLYDDLAYNKKSNPVSLVIDKTFEVYINNPTANTPAIGMLAQKGDLFGISCVVGHPSHSPAFIWDMSSGARSIFMLPKISQSKKYKKLRTELNINTEIAKSNLDHWRVFADISNCEIAPTWRSKNLYFSGKWFENLNELKWSKFFCYILNKFRKTYDKLGNMYIWDMLLCLILQEKDIRPSLFINNSVKHLFQIYLGVCPGISPAIENTQAPISFIQDTFITSYGLNDYIPTIMTPCYFSTGENIDPVYYSLLTSNPLDTPKKKDNSSTISELYDIYSLLQKYLHAIKSNKFNLEQTPFHNGINNLNITAFHPEPEKYRALESTKKIIDMDQRFTKTIGQENCNGKKVALHSSILNGCFKFSYDE